MPLRGNIGVARVGAVGAFTYPQGGGKIRRNLRGKFVSAPQAEQESIVRTFLLGGADLEGRSGLDDKKVVNFFKEKSAPQGKIMATPMPGKAV